MVDHLIVTADDFGLATEVNEAVEVAHRDGILSAASLMVAGPAAADAVRRARSMPTLRVGLHLVLVDGKPLLPRSQVSHLVDDKGRLRSNMASLACTIAARRTARRQLADEIEAQMAAFLATDLPLDHVNAHKHFHLHPMVADIVLEVATRMGVCGIRVPQEPVATLQCAVSGETAKPDRMLQPWVRLLRHKVERAGLSAPKAVYGLRWSGAMTRQRLAGLLANMPAGTVEIYTHPATADTFAGHAAGYRYRDEFEALCDPDVRIALGRSGRRLVGYAEMAAAERAAATRRFAPA